MERTIAIPGPGAMLRHAWPKLVEAKVIPTVLFLSFLSLAGITWSLIVALAWVAGCLLIRKCGGHEIPGLVIIGLISLTIRTIITLMTGSTLVYFLQPTLSTTCMGLAFLWSVRQGKPLAGRIAGDFCPFDKATTDEPAVARFFVRMSLFWAAASLLNGAVTFWMLFSVDIATFVLVKSIMGPGFTAIAIGASVLGLRRQLRVDGVALVFTKRVTKPTATVTPAPTPLPVMAHTTALAA